MCASQTCREAAGRQPRALGQRAWPFRQAGRVRAHARYRPACCILHRSFSRLPKDAFSAIFLKGLKGLQCHARERQLPHKAYKSMRATSPSCKRNCSITSGSHGQAQLQVGTQTCTSFAQSLGLVANLSHRKPSKPGRCAWRAGACPLCGVGPRLSRALPGGQPRGGCAPPRMPAVGVPRHSGCCGGARAELRSTGRQKLGSTLGGHGEGGAGHCAF